MELANSNAMSDVTDSAEGAGLTGHQQQADVLVLRQPLQCRGDALRDRLNGIADALQMVGEPIEEAGRSALGGRQQ